MSWPQFLQLKQVEGSIRYAIEDQTRTQIASQEQLARLGYSVTRDALRSGFSRVEADMRQLDQTLVDRTTVLDSTLHWGFSECLVALGQIDVGLSELIRITSNPSATWNLEHFHRALDERRRGLFKEALFSVGLAIDGRGDANAPYRSEFRFHHLLGVLKLGDYRNADPEVIDLDGAEEAFLNAARYATTDYPAEAARAWLCAAQAAYLNRHLERALVHVDKSIGLFFGCRRSSPPGYPRIEGAYAGPEMAPGFLLKAQILCEQGMEDEAEPALAIALMLEPRLALQALTSDLFSFGLRGRAVESATAHWRAEFSAVREKHVACTKRGASLKFDDLKGSELLAAELAKLVGSLARADEEASARGLASYYLAHRQLHSDKELANRLPEMFVAAALSEIDKPVAPAARVYFPNQTWLAACAGMLTFWITLFTKRDNLVFGWAVLYGFGAWIAALIVIGIAASFYEEGERNRFNNETHEKQNKIQALKLVDTAPGWT